MDAAYPRRFGPYVLVRALGDGGMASVDLALSGAPGKERACVIKRVQPELQEQGDSQARFQHELDLARRLSHPAIIQTLTVGEVDGEPVIVQEFVEGHDLSLVMTRRRVPVELAAFIIREVAAALQYAHDFEGIGLVHRDVAPGNVQIAFSGDVKLLDFGVAKSDAQAFLTQAGYLVGRPSYTPPEVWAGGRPDRRADVYALGVVLWQLLAGRLLGSLSTIGPGRAQDAPPPSTLREDVAPTLDAIVAKAVAADPGQRYQTAKDVRVALEMTLPPNFDGAGELRTFMGALFDIEQERKLLADDVARAKELVAGGEGGAPAISQRFRPAIWLAGCGLLAAVGGGAIVMRGSSSDRPREIGQPVGTASATPESAQERNAVDRVAPGARSAGQVTPTSVPPPLKTAASTPAVSSQPMGSSQPSSDDRPSHAAGEPRRPPGDHDVFQKRSVDILLQDARRSFLEGRLEDAERLATSAATAGAGANAQVLLGTIFLQRGRTAEAERAFVEAKRLDPSNEIATSRLRALRTKQVPK